MNRETGKDLAKEHITDYLRGRGIDPGKPFPCLNPEHADRHPSMRYDRTRKRCHCFSCGVSYDIFDLIGIDYGLTGAAVFDKAYSLFGIHIDGAGQQEPSGRANPKSKKTEPAKAEPAKEPPQPKEAEDERGALLPKEEEDGGLGEYFAKAEKALAADPVQAYLKSRGISPTTAAAFWLGYDEQFRTFNVDEDGQSAFATWRALIIPTGRESFVARNIDRPAEPAKKNRYRKKGPSLVFNCSELYNAQKPIFVVEGELDAISITEVGGRAIALGSTSNYTKLLALVREQPPIQPLILALDADEEGQKTEGILAGELEKLKIPFYRQNPCGTAKDANEALLIDREGFAREVQAAERTKEEELKAAEDAQREEYKKTSAGASLRDFLHGITESANTPAISTGFANLDRALDGGLYEGLYFMGGISSLGKTTLALQLADNLAQAGQDVIIFSLEMSRFELIAKSISRNTFLLAENPKDAKTTRGITAGSRYERYSQSEKALISRAVKKYEEYAGHIFIHEGMGDVGTEKIRETVGRHISFTGNRPVVIIDYVQILSSPDIRASDKQSIDRNIVELKRISRDFKITVFGISSFNRDSYKNGGGLNRGKVSMTDFKESGSIEYSSDVLMGLEFAAAGSDYDEAKEKKKDPRRIRLVVLKNRNGKAWESAGFSYYPLFNYFEEEKPAEIFAGMTAK